MVRRGAHAAKRIAAGIHREQGLEHRLLILGHVAAGIGQLEVHAGEAERTGRGDVSQLHRGRPQREYPGSRALGMGRQIDQQVDAVGRDAARGLPLAQAGEWRVLPRRRAKAGRDLILASIQRVAENLEAAAIVPLDHRRNDRCQLDRARHFQVVYVDQLDLPRSARLSNRPVMPLT